MKKFFLSLLLLVTSYALLVTSYAQDEGVGTMKKVVMIIAAEGFRDEELLRPKEILERNGIAVKVASTSLDTATGMLGAKVKPDMLLSDIDAIDFAGIVFVGGGGASQYWNDPVAQQLAQTAYHNNRIVAAICIAPVTLANAGILKGKRATVWSSEADKLQSAGANYTGRPVEKDDNLITASGPTAAVEFGNELARALKK